MKLTLLLLIVACLQLSAKSYSQTVTLSVKDASLKEVFRQISEQTGYDFFFSTSKHRPAS